MLVFCNAGFDFKESSPRLEHFWKQESREFFRASILFLLAAGGITCALALWAGNIPLEPISTPLCFALATGIAGTVAFVFDQGKATVPLLPLKQLLSSSIITIFSITVLKDGVAAAVSQSVRHPIKLLMICIQADLYCPTLQISEFSDTSYRMAYGTNSSGRSPWGLPYLSLASARTETSHYDWYDLLCRSRFLYAVLLAL